MTIKITERQVTNYPLSANPLLNRIYNGRGIISNQELDYNLKYLKSYEKLLGIEAGVALLLNAWHKQEKIMIVGDFDTDGAASTALAYLILKAFGFQRVDYCIPDRFKQGYGLTEQIVQSILPYQPDLIITVDNGIVHYEGVNLAHQHHIKVLITDHHLPNGTLPEAEAIINPNQIGDQSGLNNLVGAGVFFYLMIALRAALRKIGKGEIKLANYLDLVALATVSDAATLDYNNRILVANGLKLMRKGATRLGILALLNEAKKDFKQITVGDLAFCVIPRLNAAGRLEHMKLGVEILITLSNVRALALAKNLDRLNETRKKLSNEMFQQALEQIDQENASICLFDQTWHQGIVGVVASKIAEQCNCPVVLFAPGQEDRELKGSARSVVGLNIRALFAEIADAFPGIIRYFGGHAMAAGITINYDQRETFQQVFNEFVLKKQLTKQPVEYLVDGELSTSELTLENALLLNQQLFGHGFEEPLFVGNFTVIRINILKTKHAKLFLRDERSQKEWEAIYFNVKNIENLYPYLGKTISIVYKLAVNSFNQKLQVQLPIVEVLDE